MTIELVGKLYEDYEKPFVTSAQENRTTTVLLDGRSNVNGDSMIFVGFATEQGFVCWRAGINAADQKKSAQFLDELIEQAVTHPEIRANI
jgi:hypothetical protein